MDDDYMYIYTICMAGSMRPLLADSVELKGELGVLPLTPCNLFIACCSPHSHSEANNTIKKVG